MSAAARVAQQRSLLVVDGQQRLTTCVVLLAALRACGAAGLDTVPGVHGSRVEPGCIALHTGSHRYRIIRGEAFAIWHAEFEFQCYFGSI